MARVKRAVNAHKKRRVVLERASGYRGQRSRLYRKAKEQLLHSFNYNFRDRKARKGDFRKLWIQRINAAVRAEGITVALWLRSPSPTRTPSRPSWTPPRPPCLRTSTLRLRPDCLKS
mgnify:CR=1 FL=1